MLVIAGSGLSASSGIKPFRGEEKESYYCDGRSFDGIDLFAPEAFIVDDVLVWKFHAYLRQNALKAEPNNAHIALAKLAQKLGPKMLTINQNFDCLSIRAGHPKEQLASFNGSLFDVKCTKYRCKYRKTDFSPNLGQFSVPKCPVCGSVLRPGVVWFGESVPYTALDKANDFLMNKVDLLILAGISAEVWPAAGYIQEVRAQGGEIAVFTLEDLASDVADVVVTGDCTKTLPAYISNLI